MLTRKSNDFLEYSFRLRPGAGVGRSPSHSLNTFLYILFILILLFGVNVDLGEQRVRRFDIA